MPRPRKQKRIREATDYVYGCRRYDETVNMTHEQLETIRFIDLEKLTQEETAEKMAVSRATIQALYKQARETIAEAVIQQKNIQISGGDYTLTDDSHHHENHHCRHQGEHRGHHGHRHDDEEHSS